jgi:hypothetical protein
MIKFTEWLKIREAGGGGGGGGGGMGGGMAGTDAVGADCGSHADYQTWGACSDSHPNKRPKNIKKQGKK